MPNNTDQAAGVDKRKLKRRHLIYYLRVFDRNSGELLGHLVDVTQEGVKLISENPIPVMQRFQLRMLLPAEIFGRNELNFEAESLWSYFDINPQFHDTGFRLIDVDTRDMLTIARLINEFGFRD
ncbi:MAG: hypothetical protein RBS57_00710 [Desulforhabdus sp.]|jgi:hypothetical protein|nr:hypothetical protein [Desulforhabdus sp.]